jgi:transposase InsO family protein
VTFDFIVKLPKTSRGNDSICVFVDKLTKLVHFVACKEALSAKKFAELYVDRVFVLHRLSRGYITDRDTRFTSAFWQEVTVQLGTRTVMSSSFHPQTDGQTERVNQTLETYLRHYVSVELNDWDTLLSRAEFAHNVAYHETIRSTPFELTFRYSPRTPVGEVVEVVNPASVAFVERLQSALSLARKCLIAAQQRQKAFADQHRVEKVYKFEDKVLLSTRYLNLKHSQTNRKQLLPKWTGPFEVVQVVVPVAFELKMNPGWRVHPVFHTFRFLSRTGKAAGYNPHHLLLKWKALLSMRWSRFLSIDFGALGTPKPTIRLPGRVMVSSITLGIRSRTS